MLTTDFEEFLAHSKTIVIGNQSPLFRGLLKKAGKERSIVDLVNLMSRRRKIVATAKGSPSKSAKAATSRS
jgi:hypothetical protein